MAKNQYKSELLIRSHCGGRGFESLQVHQVNPGDFRKKVAGVFLFLSFQAPVGETQQELSTPETSIFGVSDYLYNR